MSDFRPDVEGLRAVAVIVVLLFHANLLSFTGGFIGVDVFFVVSGFLITRLLVKEMATHGTISLPAFWARRARRLLPAAVLTLVVTLVFANWILPPLRQREVLTDAFFVSGFVVNFRFARTLGDYFGAQLGAITPSPLLHYWSLAVEEQFYLVWPATMLLLSRRPRQFRRLLTTVIIAVGVASLLVSVWWTENNPTAAFYLLPARMVELLSGALLAVAGTAVARWSPLLRGRLGWIGLFGIAVAAVFYDESVAFPGTAVLLPVVATMAVIVAGMAPSWEGGPSRLLNLDALQWVGRHSYAIYLWHWPVLVLAEARQGSLSVFERLVAIAVSCALAALSLHFVENPVRFSKALAAPASRGLALGAALTVGALAMSGLLWGSQPDLTGGGQAAHITLEAGVDAAASETAGSGAAPDDAAVDASRTSSPVKAPAGEASVPARAPTDLAGLVAATQRILADAATNDAVPSNLRPSLTRAGDDKAQPYRDDCVNIGVEPHVKNCRYGEKGSAKKFVLYGDSHAAHWFPAMDAIAKQRGAELIVLTKGGCPPADVPIKTNTLGRTCPVFRNEAVELIAKVKPALVVISAQSDYFNKDSEWQAGMVKTLKRIAPNTKDLVVLADNPGSADIPANCLSRHLTSATACNNRRERAIAPGRLAAEAAAAVAAGGRVIDPTDWMCTPSTCPVIVGDILLYRDADHLTTEAADFLMPLLRAALFA